jgi:hypothetical protein
MRATVCRQIYTHNPTEPPTAPRRRDAARSRAAAADPRPSRRSSQRPRPCGRVWVVGRGTSVHTVDMGGPWPFASKRTSSRREGRELGRTDPAPSRTHHTTVARPVWMHYTHSNCRQSNNFSTWRSGCPGPCPWIRAQAAKMSPSWSKATSAGCPCAFGRRPMPVACEEAMNE